MSISYILLFGPILLFWLGVVVRVRKEQKEQRWRLGLNAPVLEKLPRLRVIIPARDEARNIVDCLKGVLASEHPDFGVTVFDDGSSDGTGKLAAGLGDSRVTVVTGEGSLPALEGGGFWRGKTWALQRAGMGVEEDWILFLDADVRVHPKALSIAHSFAVTEGADFFTGFGRLLMESFWEKVIQPTMGGLILSGNPLEKVNDDAEQEKVIANGQFILVRREAYERLGRHTAVADNILEDVGLARHFRKNGAKMRARMARELFSCRMYTSLSEIWLGWTKNFYVGLRKKPHIVALLLVFLFFDILVPHLALLVGLVTGGELLVWGLVLVGVVQGVRFWMDRVFEQDWRYGFLQPLSAVMVGGILVDSMRRARAGKLVWKGREYGV
jgi:glycosyltransferase involved in cell wall biosynthesis